MDIPYDPVLWNVDGDFNVELKYDIDRMNYTYHCTDTVSSDGSWFSGILPSLHSKSCIAVAHGFVDDDSDERFSSPSLKSLHSSMEIPPSPLSNNHSSLSTPSLRYTTNMTIPPLPQTYPETSPSSSSSGVGAGTGIVLLKNLRLYNGHKLKLLPSSSSSFLKKLRLKIKSKLKEKRKRFYRLDSSSYERQQQQQAGPETETEPQQPQIQPERRQSESTHREDDIALYPDDLDPDPFAKQFGPYRVGLY